jgi:predicted peptidase
VDPAVAHHNVHKTTPSACPVCGGGDIETATVIKNIPIWIFHGSTDKVVKASRSNDMYEALKKVGGDVKYSEYQEVGHDSWKPAYREPDFLKWMWLIVELIFHYPRDKHIQM